MWRSLGFGVLLAGAGFLSTGGGPVVAADVNWLPDAGGQWGSSSNWSSSPVLPGAADDVVIDVGGAATQFITHDFGSTTIRSLTSEESLRITGSSLTVTAGDSTVNAPFTVAGGSFAVDGPGATFTANAATDINTGSLFARAGGTIELPQLTAVNGAGFAFKNYVAQGAGSRLDLSSLTQLSGASAAWTVTLAAEAWGVVDLSSLTDIPAGNLTFLADGVGSRVEMPLITQPGRSSARRTLEARNGGVVQIPLATNLDYVHLIERSNGQVQTGVFNSLQFGGIALDNTTRDLSAITRIEYSSLSANGGATISLPSVTAYLSPLNASKFWEANGPGSRVELPALTYFQGATGGVTLPHLSATAGGTVDLSHVVQITGGSLSATADGPGSLVDLSRLSSTGSSALARALEVRNQGTIRMPLVTRLDGADIAVRSGGQLITGPVTSVFNGKITLDNAAHDFSALDEIDRSSLYALGGATLSLPAVTSYEGGSQVRKEWQALGAGSRLELPALQQMAGVSGETLRIEARDGGVIDLPSLAQMGEGGIYVWSHGSGSRVNLSNLQVVARLGSERWLWASNGGVIELPSGVSLDYAVVSLDRGGQIDVSTLTSMMHGVFSVDGSNVVLPVSNFDGSGLQVGNGGTLTLPNLTQYNGESRSSRFWHASGVGTRLDVSQVQELSGPTHTNNYLAISSQDGGLVDLSGLQRITSGTVFISPERNGTIRLGHLGLDGVNQRTGSLAAGRLEILQDFTHRATDPANIPLDNVTVAFLGTQPQTLEIAGRNLGLAATAVDNNFALGQLVVGAAGVDADLVLVDAVDNGRRNGVEREALYLRGIDSADGLRILGGSTLHIGDSSRLQVFARIGGVLTHLHGLFPGPHTTIPFDQGFISNSPLLPGDVNLDGLVSAVDIDRFCGALAAQSASPLFDLNATGVTDPHDLDILVHTILDTEFGDANLDGHVDRRDAATLASNFGATAGWAAGDFTCDGVIGIADLHVLNQHLGFTASSPVAPETAAIPEPATFALGALLVLALGPGRSYRRRRRDRATGGQ